MNQYASTNSLLTATDGYGVWQDICSAFVSAGYAGPFDISGWSAQLLSTTAGIYSNPIFDCSANGSATIAGTLNVSPTMTMTPNHIGINTAPRSEALAINGDLLVRGVFRSPAALTADIISVATQTDYSGTAVHLPSSTRSAHIQYSDSSRYTIYLPSPTSEPALPLAHSLIVHNQTGRTLSISVEDGTALLDVSSSVATTYLPPSEARQFVLGRACTCPIACSHTESNTPYMYYQRPFVGPDFPSLAPYVDLSAGAAIISAIATDASAVTDISTIISQKPTQTAISTLSTGIAIQNGAYNTLSTYIGVSTATQIAFQDLSAATTQAATQISDLEAAADRAIQTLVTPAQISSFSTSLASLTSEISHLSSYVYSESTVTLANYSTVSSTVRDLSAAIQDISSSLPLIATAADFAAVSSAFSTATADFSTLSTTFDSIKARDVTRADYDKQVDAFSTTIKNLTALSTSIDTTYKYYSTPVLGDQYAGMSTHFYEMQNTHVVYTYNSYYSANMTELSTYIGDLTGFDSTLRAQIGASTATTQDLSTLSSSLLNVFALSTYVGTTVPTYSTISSIYRTDASNRSSINTLSNYVALNVPSKTQYATLETAATLYSIKENALGAYIYGSADPGAASKAVLSTVGDGVEFISTGISSLEAYIGVSTIPLSTFTDLSAAFNAYSTTTVKRIDVSNVTADARFFYGNYMSTISTLDGRVHDISSYAHTSLADADEYSATKSSFTGFCLSNYTTASTTVYVSTAKLADYVAISSLISTSYATPYGTLSSYVAASTLTVQTFSTFSTNITNDLTDSVAALYENPEIIGDFLINSTYTTAIIKPIGPRAVPGTAGGPLYIVGDPSGGINVRSRTTVFTTWLGDEGAGGVTADFKGALSNVGGTFSGSLVNATGSFHGALKTTGDLTVESGSITAARGNLIVDNSDIRVQSGNIYAQTFYGNINGPNYTDAITKLDSSQNIRTAGDLTVGYSMFGRGRTDLSSLVVDQILLKPNLVPLKPPRPFEAQQFTAAPFDVDASGMAVRVAGGYPVVFAWRELVYKINVANFQRYPPNGWAPVVFRLDKAYEFFTLEIRQEDDGLMTVPGQDIQPHTAGYIRITGRAGQAQALDVEFELAHGSTATPLFQDIEFNSGVGAYGYLTVWLWVGQTGIQADEVVYQWRGTNHVQLAGFAGNTDTVVVNETLYAFRGIGAFQPQPPFVADGGAIMVSGKTDLLGFGGSIIAQAEGINGVMLGVNRQDPAYNLDVSGSAFISNGLIVNKEVKAKTINVNSNNGLHLINGHSEITNATPTNLNVSEQLAAATINGDVYISGNITQSGVSTVSNHIIFISCSGENGVMPGGVLLDKTACVEFSIDIKTLRKQYNYVRVIAMGAGGGGAGVFRQYEYIDLNDVYGYQFRGGGGGGSGNIIETSYKLPDNDSADILNITIGLGGKYGSASTAYNIDGTNYRIFKSDNKSTIGGSFLGLDGGKTIIVFGRSSLQQISADGGNGGTQMVGGSSKLYGGGTTTFIDQYDTREPVEFARPTENKSRAAGKILGLAKKYTTTIIYDPSNTIYGLDINPSFSGNGFKYTDISYGQVWQLYDGKAFRNGSGDGGYACSTGGKGSNNVITVGFSDMDVGFDYDYGFSFTPGGGGGGPYGGNGAKFTEYKEISYDDQDGQDQPVELSGYVIPAGFAQYGCGGGGGIAAVDLKWRAPSDGEVILNNTKHLPRTIYQSGETSTRGGDGWIVLEFYNTAPQFSIYNVGASQRILDIRDIIEPVKLMANDTYHITPYGIAWNQFTMFNLYKNRQFIGTGNIVEQLTDPSSIYVRFNEIVNEIGRRNKIDEFEDNVVNRINSLSPGVNTSWSSYVTDNRNDAYIRSGNTSGNYVYYKTNNFLYNQGELIDQSGRRHTYGDANPAVFRDLSASFVPALTYLDSSNELIYRAAKEDNSGNKILTPAVDGSGFSVINQSNPFDPYYPGLGILNPPPYLTQDPSVSLSDAPFNYGHIVTPSRFDNSVTYNIAVPYSFSSYPYAFINQPSTLPSSSPAPSDQASFIIQATDGDLKYTNLFYQRNLSMDYPLIHIIARKQENSPIGFEIGGRANFDADVISYHPPSLSYNWPPDPPAGYQQFVTTYAVKVFKRAASVNKTFILLSMILGHPLLNSQYGAITVNVNYSTYTSRLECRPSTVNKVNNLLGVAMLIPLNGTDLFTGVRVEKVRLLVEDTIIPIYARYLGTVFSIPIP